MEQRPVYQATIPSNFRKAMLNNLTKDATTTPA